MDSFRDQVAVITGAASGIGQAVAEQLAQRGCHLALVDINAVGLEETAARASSAGCRVSTYVVDVSNHEQMSALPESVLNTHQRIDILINNAGVSLAGPFERYSIDDLEWILGINLWGTIYGCKYFLPTLRQRGAGIIANIASDFGIVGLPGKTAYCTTKFAIRGFSEALRAELWGTGITVICVYPGAVDTGLIRNSRAADPIKRDIEARFVASRGIPIDRVAKRIIYGIERGQGRVLIGMDTRAIDWMARWFPDLTAFLIGRFHKRLPFM
jgi:short-subunit dehydrogenase